MGLIHVAKNCNKRDSRNMNFEIKCRRGRKNEAHQVSSTDIGVAGLKERRRVSKDVEE